MTERSRHRTGRILAGLLLGLAALMIVAMIPMQGRLGSIAFAADQGKAQGEVEVLAPKAEKKVYLTFDDGPSTHTKAVLDILAKEKVTGTFFVLGKQVKQYPALIQRIVDEGHAIGNHSYNHQYNELYSDFRNFWSQIRKTGGAIKDVIGYEPRLVRAPGGTFLNFDQQYFNLLEQAGYIVHDWNVDSNDSKRVGVPAREIVQGVKSGALGSSVIVLMHDGIGHGETVKALPEIIQYYKHKGYSFEVLTPEIKPVQFQLASRDRWHRNPVSKTWIDANVASVQVTGKPEIKQQFKIWTNNGEVLFEPGQYRAVAGVTYVPVRTLVEKLKGTVSYSAMDREVVVTISSVQWGMDAVTGKARLIHEAGMSTSLPWKSAEYDHQIYVPLRQALEASRLSLTQYEFIPVEEA